MCPWLLMDAIVYEWYICKLPPHILVVLVVLSGIDDFVVLNFGSISSIE